MPYCTKCGCEVSSKMLFCPECGTKLTISKTGTEDNKTYEHGTEAEDKKAAAVPAPPKKGKLYKQWIEYAGLPAEEVPSAPSKKEKPEEEEENNQKIYILYILLGLIIIILGTGLAFLFMEYW